jgi:hypothetical protein
MYGIRATCSRRSLPRSDARNEMNGARSAASRNSYAAEPTSADIHTGPLPVHLLGLLHQHPPARGAGSFVRMR